MIGLRLNAKNTWLDIAPGTVLTLNLVCPIFDRDAIERTWSYPFKLPTSPRNLKALQFINRVDFHGARVIVEDVSLYIYGQEFERGNLLIQGASENVIDCVIQSVPINLVERLKQERIRETTDRIDIAGKVRGDFTFQFSMSESEYITTELEGFAIGVMGKVYTSSLSLSLNSLVDAINEDWPGLASGAWYQELDPSTFYWELTFDNAAVDNLVIDDRPADYPSFLYARFARHSNTLDEEANRVLSLWETFISEGGNTLARLPIVNAPNLYEEKNAAYTGLANYMLPDGSHPADDIGTIADKDTGWGHTLLPLATLSGRIDWLRGLGYNFGGTWLADQEVQDLLIWHNRPTENFLSWQIIFPNRPDENQYRSYPHELYLSDVLPDISAWDMLAGVMETFFLFLRNQDGILAPTPVRELLRGAPEDWTAKAEPKYKMRVDKPKGYTLDFDRQKDETQVAGQLERIDGGSEALEFITPFYTLFELEYMDSLAPSDRTLLLPYITEAGTSSYFDISEEATRRLLFYRGSQPDDSGNQYELATHDVQRLDGDPVGSISFDWQGDAGRLDNYAIDFIRLMTNGRTVTRLVRLSIADLLELRRWRHVRKYIYSESGTITGVVRTVKVKVGQSGMSVAEVVFQIEPN